MGISIQKGLFRVYKVLAVLIFVLSILIMADESGTDSIYQIVKYWYLCLLAIFASLLLSTLPWIIHYIVMWIIKGFIEDQHKVDDAKKEVHVTKEISSIDTAYTNDASSKAKMKWKPRTWIKHALVVFGVLGLICISILLALFFRGRGYVINWNLVVYYAALFVAVMIGSLIGSLLVQFACKKVLRFRPPYGMSYKATFLGYLGYYIGVVVVTQFASPATKQISHETVYILLCVVLGLSAQATLFSRLIKYPDGKSIGFIKAVLVSLIEIALRILIFVILGIIYISIT